MGFRMHSLLALWSIAFVVCGKTALAGDDIWSNEVVTEYAPITSSSPTPPPVVSCTVKGEKGQCVPSRLYCKTKYDGTGAITWRSTPQCSSGLCCVLRDVVSTEPPTGGSTEPSTGGGTEPSTGGGTEPSTGGRTGAKGCGIRNKSLFNRGSAAVTTARFGEFPWTVVIYEIENKKQNYLAVGSLIHPRVVLTAGKKFDRGGNFKVRAGDWYLPGTNERKKHEERDVASMVIHESYNSGSGENDIGLLFLDKDIKQDLHINYACLPNTNVVTQPSTVCLVTGWGSVTVDGPNQETQKMIELPVIDRNTCLTKIRKGLDNDGYNLSSSMMCAGGNGKTACNGDDGAPLVCPYPGQTTRYYQAGLVSWGVGCQDLPGVYTDVSQLREWVDKKIIAAGFTTNYYTP